MSRYIIGNNNLIRTPEKRVLGWASAETDSKEIIRELNELLDRVEKAEAREAKLRDAVLAVLCDPDGRPCFNGSDGDRAVIAEALDASSESPGLAELRRDKVQRRVSRYDFAGKLVINEFGTTQFVCANREEARRAADLMNAIREGGAR